jgi:hypothetical protein
MSTPTPTSTGTGIEPNTPAQASLYQQLRGHLAALKLHTAAEHLPSVLDRAAAEKLSLTAALERLLALEVDATEAAGSPAGCGSPPCPPQRPWRSSTTTPNPPRTARSSRSWPPAATWNRPPTCC